MNEQQKIQAIIEIVRQGSGATDAKRDLEGVEKASGLLDEKLKGLATTMAAAFSAREIVRFAADSVRAFAESERGLNLLNNTLKASGQFSQAYILELRNLAEAMAEVSTADDDAIIAAERTMLSFGAQRRDMERLTKAALDLSVGLGVDLQTAASQLGRAVAGETMSFNRLGFEIDQNADAATRLNQVLDQVNTRFGGLAKGEMDTLHGQTTQLTKAWGELKEAIGGVLGGPAASALGVVTGELNALRGTLSVGDQNEQRKIIEAELARMNAEGKLSPQALQLQLRQLEEGFAARRAVTQTVVTDPEFQRMETFTAYEVDREARAAALARAQAGLGVPLDAEAAARAALAAQNAGRSTGEQFGPSNPFTGEMFGPTNAEANEQRRKLAREAADEIKALEQSLTLESIRAGDFRLSKVQEEYNHRVDLYRRLYSEHKLSEDELTNLTRDAAFERDRAIEESIQRQRELERQAHEERLREWRQVTGQIQQTIASNVSGALVNAFRQGKFEADKFFSDLFAQIAQLIIQMLILRALRGIFGTAMAEGGAVMAAGGLPPTFAAGGLDGVTALNHATYHPRFNVIAGEAGLEMMTVLSRPRPMAFGGVEAVTGFARGRELAVMPAGGAAMLAAGQSGNTGRIVIDVNLDPGLRANITQEAVAGAEVRLTQQAGRDSEFRRAINNARS